MAMWNSTIINVLFCFSYQVPVCPRTEGLEKMEKALLCSCSGQSFILLLSNCFLTGTHTVPCSCHISYIIIIPVLEIKQNFLSSSFENRQVVNSLYVNIFIFLFQASSQATYNEMTDVLFCAFLCCLIY